VKPSIKRKVNLLIFFSIALLLLYFAFKGVDFDAMVTGFKNANYYWVFLSLIVGFASHVVRALRWQLLIEPIGYKPSLFNTLGAIITGYVANLVFPRLGEITRCGTLRKTDKVPFESLLGTVIVERAFDVLMMFALVVVVFFIRIDFFGTFIWEQGVLPITSKVKSLLIESPIYIVAFVAFLFILGFLLKRKVFGHKFSSRIASLFWGLIDGLKSVFTMKKRKEFLGYTLLIWMLYWLMTWLLIFSTQPTSGLGPIDGFFLLVIGSFGMAAPVQGGIGAFHVITAMALGIYGLTWDEGLVFATISHGSQTLLVVVLGIFFATIFFLRGRIKPAIES
jgi:uncharacterized protein (TIRG00374 family)